MAKRPQPDSFYKTAAWKRVRAMALRRDNYQCVVCHKNVRGKGNSRCDHRLSVKTHPELKLELSNLQTLCPSCDNKKHREKGGKDWTATALDGSPIDGPSWT